MLKPVIKQIEVNCSQEDAFNLFVKETTSWWPLDKNSVSAMSGEVAQSVMIEPKMGGKITEIGHDGTEYLWGSVTEYDPHALLQLAWHIGLPADNASMVKVSFEAISAERTRVELTHSNWEVFGDKAADMHAGYSKGWVGVFEEAFASICNKATS